MIAPAELKRERLEPLNVTSSAFKESAYDYYARLRNEAPVYPVKLPSGQTIWLISRYDDVQALLKDDRLVKSKRNVPGTKSGPALGFLPFIRVLERNMLDLDAPDHSRLRGLVHQGFTPKLIERMTGRIHSLSQELAWKAKQKGELELIADYALPIPMTIISEILGIPERYRDPFHRLSTAAVDSTSSSNVLAALPAMWRMVRLLRQVLKVKQANPADDLMTALIEAKAEGDHLTEDELLGMIVLLIIAGHETTVNLIANGALALLENLTQLELLRQNPDLYKTAIEECARYYSPVEVATERYTREPIEYAGISIAKGQQVAGILASANRDESQFVSANKLDLSREKNRHLAYGQGIHYCLGAPLARLEGTIALQTLLENFPNLQLSVPREKLKWRPGLNLRGLERLPLKVK